MSSTPPEEPTGQQVSDTRVSGDLLLVQGVTGDVAVHSGAPVRSGYLEQVKRIAPQQLLDRDRELTALAEFCHGSGEDPYLWWRAAAWTGKSALLSWFVLHPPPRVRLVSFFVTARFSAQSDRVAFTDVVLEQLAELLDQSMPTYLTEATREAHYPDTVVMPIPGGPVLAGGGDRGRDIGIIERAAA